MDRKTNKKSIGQVDEQTAKHAGRQTDIQTDRQTDRQIDRQTDRQAGRQADRQTASQLTCCVLPVCVDSRWWKMFTELPLVTLPPTTNAQVKGTARTVWKGKE